MNMSTGGQPPFDPNRPVESKEDVGSSRRIVTSLVTVLGFAIVSITLWLTQSF